MHSISDLTTFCRKTTGDVPEKLVGASTTVVGSKLYLFGGRLVTERRMVSDLYLFDLESYHWEKLIPYAEDEVPQARYFHSADAWNNQLVIFGGMSNKVNSANPEDLCVLNDVRFFDIATRRWRPSSSSNGVLSDPVSGSLVPRARYAHLSSVTADRLFVIGGQDFYNVWLDDVYVYDLLGKVWVQRRDYPRHCGTYRSVAVSANMRFRLPQEELRSSRTPSKAGPPGTCFKQTGPPTTSEFTSPDSFIHMPYSAIPTEDYPCDIYLYSNYNFTDVKRELEVFSPLPDSDFTIQDRSLAMTGASFPPGLRFPSGAVLGTHFIVAGTYLAHTYQSYSIWALDLLTMTWSRIDPGSAVSTGSWFRGCLWVEDSKFIIFGNRNGNLVDDYNRRLLSWDHVAIVDLESFGIYQPPSLELQIPMQQLGLAALEEGLLTDFSLVCDDGRKISCSRKMLEDRWPWFKDQLKRFGLKAGLTLQSLPTSPTHIPLPTLPGVVAGESPRPDPRLTPRAFHLSEPYPITLALLQYFYSLALITPLQHSPPVLSQLLILSSMYQITHLESLVKHAMHRALSNSTSVGVYEVATLCSCRSLQIRALKTVMSYSQRRSGRSRQDREDGSGGHRPPDANTGGRSYTGGGNSSASSRPRGTSDAIRSIAGGGSSVPGSSRYLTKVRIQDEPSSSLTDMHTRSKYIASKFFNSSRFTLQRQGRPFSVPSSTRSAPSTVPGPTLSTVDSRDEPDPQTELHDAVSLIHESNSSSEGSKAHDDISGTSPPSVPPLDLRPYPPQSPPRLYSNYSESEPDESDYPRTPISSSFAAFHLPRSFSGRAPTYTPSTPDPPPASFSQSKPWMNSPAASVSLLDFSSMATLTIDEEQHTEEDDRISLWSLSSGISSLLSALYGPPPAPSSAGQALEAVSPEEQDERDRLMGHHHQLQPPPPPRLEDTVSLKSAIIPFPPAPSVTSQDSDPQPASFFDHPRKRKESPTAKKFLMKRRLALSDTDVSHTLDEEAFKSEERRRKRPDLTAKLSLRRVVPV